MREGSRGEFQGCHSTWHNSARSVTASRNVSPGFARLRRHAKAEDVRRAVLADQRESRAAAKVRLAATHARKSKEDAGESSGGSKADARHPSDK
jgi:hypothetical protein